MFAERHGVEVAQTLVTMRAHPRGTRQPRLAVVSQVIDGTFETSTVRCTR